MLFPLPQEFSYIWNWSVSNHSAQWIFPLPVSSSSKTSLKSFSSWGMLCFPALGEAPAACSKAWHTLCTIPIDFAARLMDHGWMFTPKLCSTVFSVEVFHCQVTWDVAASSPLGITNLLHFICSATLSDDDWGTEVLPYSSFFSENEKHCLPV